MLVRNAARKQRRQTARLLETSFAQLTLPWLAPAQLRWQASQAAVADQASRHPRRRSPSRTHYPAAQTRGLATATDQHAPRYSAQYPPPGYDSAFRNIAQDRNIPWDAPHHPKSLLSNLRDAHHDLIVLDTTTQIPPQSIKVAHGIHGTAIDLLQHLQTFLQVGRLDRAEITIHKLADLCSNDSAELWHAHTTYLEDCRRRLALHGKSEESMSLLHAMQKWFEVEVRSKRVSVDHKMLVVMIRASIRALDGTQRDRTVRRYAEMAQELGEEQYYDVLESEDYDDNEFAIFRRIIDQSEETDENVKPEQLATEDVRQTQFRRNDALSMEEIPNVLATEQKGDGLANVKRALQDFATRPSLSADSPIAAQQEQAYSRQKLLEETSMEVAIDRWRKADEELRKLGIHTAMQSRPIGALMWQWHSALVPALQAELAECRKVLSQPGPLDNDRYHYGPYLELMSLEKLAASSIIYVLTKMSEGKSHQTNNYETEVKLAQLTVGLARTAEHECKIDARVQKSKTAGRHSNSRGFRNTRSKTQSNARVRKLSKEEEQRQALLAQLSWPIEARTKLGALLASKLIETAQLPVTREHPRTHEKVTQMQPAFLHRTRYEKGRRFGMIATNPALTEKLQSEPLGSVVAKRMPMVVEPKPWKGWQDGGYLHSTNTILRTANGDGSAKDYFKAADKRGDMSQIYAGLTALGSVPWKIHHGVFKAQVEAWNSGEEIANFAPLHPTLDALPEPPADDAYARRSWLIEMRKLEDKRTGLHSKRCFQNFQLEIARTLANETLYFPHNMDFRGRAYPIPPYLNHMGADNVRGLLIFADGKELGENGLRWLKIHLATVAGHDKASMTERVEFTMAHLDDIYDSVRSPFTGRRWWLKAEDAWQTLAACFELTEALDSPDPTKYVSHLPVQQDGTCNGLQHYAALGGDKMGAAQVNLEPSDRPADVYSAVARAVEEEVRIDAAKGNAIAKKLDGRITRKCVKQPVMTNVYGVTWYGARAQVRKQLEVIFPEVRRADEVNIDLMSQYVTDKVFKSLGEMFAGAQSIQKWLGSCADRISTCLTPQQIAELTKKGKTDTPDVPPAKRASKESAQGKVAKKKRTQKKDEALEALSHRNTGSAASNRSQKAKMKPLFKSTVVWTTPLRLPVVQPYRSVKSRQISTTLQRIQIQEPQVWHPVHKRKQLQAFPPNFIHSLDATHMLLSALKCKELGMTFASIHDSFWSHACDVDKLSSTLREAFIEMHQDNIVGRLREEFEARYKDCMYLATVIASSPVGKKITALRKDLREKSDSELATEAERLRLLNSEDPEEQAKGEAMVTPGSILAAEGDEKDLAPSPEILRHQLGNMLDRPDEEFVDEGMLAEDSDVGMEAANADQEPVSEAPARKKSLERKLFVWQPLVFPEIPPRGDFDVTKIRDSAYFFH